MLETDDLLVELRPGEYDGARALWLTFNRPEVLNAFSDELCIALAERLEDAASNDDVGVVVLTGAGPAFSAGADISGAEAHERFDGRAMDAASRIIRAVVSCPKPVVAAVNGVAAGVGCSVALAADIQVAAEPASFLLAFARIGLMPDGGTSATVAAAVGRARAMRMALLAEPLTAREAYDAGLVSHLSTVDQFPSLVGTVVGRLARGAPLAQSATKKAVNAATLDRLEDALERERTGQTILLRTHDVAEGMRAFNERRRPRFTGR